MKYHLGCRDNYIEGYINVDFPKGNYKVYKEIKADRYENILTMDMEFCTEIRNSHVFEHFNYTDSLYLLYKWYNALQINGLLRINLPDVEALCLALKNASVEKSFRIIRYLYGSHEDLWAYHINGWTASTLSHVLKSMGFNIIDVKKDGDSNSAYPNCNVEIFALKHKMRNKEKIRGILLSLFSLYKNGNTEFENKLEEFYKEQFLKKL